ncbi:hypothetical protein [Brevibacillus brevis]|uniref:hypothetical protein n=1 Tax=Brevibacillus brevis TaxID=1393 RepID=UPI000D114F16|nr:hypothetical protein [Brevibacillus brevis]PSJ67461.1 hypothetical protein C7J99_20940 [Brevibacillus brevis]RED28448.1 hypothetical protein DES34_108315 [Brevibacillus brevis]GEC90703.1 hypothetical protein BBR01nite_30340 [Brevibacillus brevis]VEF91143.1 Uncharacterised protein [Brevibacillus brevis]
MLDKIERILDKTNFPALLTGVIFFFNCLIMSIIVYLPVTRLFLAEISLGRYAILSLGALLVGGFVLWHIDREFGVENRFILAALLAVVSLVCATGTYFYATNTFLPNTDFFKFISVVSVLVSTGGLLYLNAISSARNAMARHKLENLSN